MNQDLSASRDLVIAGELIPEDEHGRFNLNKLHQLSKANVNKRPKEWLKNKHTQELISELASQGGFSPLEIIHGGAYRGTYAHELLAISYAGWISPAFQLIVNQAFLDSRTGHLPQIRNPQNQAIIHLVVRQDELEQRLIASEERDRERDRAMIAQQAEIIKSLKQSSHAEAKADMALEEMHYMTIEEFVIGQKLLRQFPKSTWQEASRWLKTFCQQWNFKILPKPTPWKSWKEENAYPLQALAAWVEAETRKRGQIRLTGIEEDGINYGLSDNV